MLRLYDSIRLFRETLMFAYLSMILCLGMTVLSSVYADSLSSTSCDRMAVDILRQVNAYRIKQGLAPLRSNAVVQREAHRHSLEMARHKVSFGHDGFQGRMSRIYHALPRASGGAENVAYRYPSATVVVQGWIHSPGHRHNLLGAYDLTGIAIVPDAKGHLYFTQMFVKISSSHRQDRSRSHRYSLQFF